MMKPNTDITGAFDESRIFSSRRHKIDLSIRHLWLGFNCKCICLYVCILFFRLLKCFCLNLSLFLSFRLFFRHNVLLTQPVFLFLCLSFSFSTFFYFSVSLCTIFLYLFAAHFLRCRTNGESTKILRAVFSTKKCKMFLLFVCFSRNSSNIAKANFRTSNQYIALM